MKCIIIIIKKNLVTNQGIITAVSVVYHNANIILFSTYSSVGGKFKHIGLILLPLDGSGYVTNVAVCTSLWVQMYQHLHP
jgi:hypothetical protein